MHHPIPQEILELAKYEVCQPDAVILNLGCTLQSPRKLKKIVDVWILSLEFLI